MPLTTMPYGKHKGQPFSELEEEYISWLLEQSYLRDELRGCLEAELDARQGGTPSKKVTTELVPAELKVYVEQIVAQGYRSVAETYDRDSEEFRLLKKAGFHLRNLLGLPGK
jgi:uncharacterized protein (DUF3820 family)